MLAQTFLDYMYYMNMDYMKYKLGRAQAKQWLTYRVKVVRNNVDIWLRIMNFIQITTQIKHHDVYSSA